MLYVVAFEECCEYSTGAESIRLQCDQDQDGGRQGVVVPHKMLVEVGDQTTWKVHDALLSSNELDSDGTMKRKCRTEVYKHFLLYGHTTVEESRTEWMCFGEVSGAEDWIAICQVLPIPLVR